MIDSGWNSTVTGWLPYAVEREKEREKYIERKGHFFAKSFALRVNR